jgi:hypothetical protein
MIKNLAELKLRVCHTIFSKKALQKDGYYSLLFFTNV